MDRAHTPIGSLMEQAACLVRRSKEAAGTPELAESYKRKQTEELIKFADANSLWIDFRSLPVIYLAKGGDEYAGDDLENFFIRMEAHNRFFPNVPYQLIGFAYNSQREFCAVLIQPYIKAEREATEEEIASYMRLLGFEMDYYDEYHNDKYKIFDAVPNNVLYGIDGNLYFIDTQIRIKRCIRMQY